MPKPFRDYDELVKILRDRGLEIDSAEALVALRRIGYHRLAGYWRFDQMDPGAGDNRFTPGSSLGQVLDVYERDAMLRAVLMEPLATVEVALRVALAHELGRAGHVYTYLNKSNFALPVKAGAELGSGSEDVVVEFRRKLRRDIQESKLASIRHHLGRGDEVPIWAALEAASFGQLSKMYLLLDDANIQKRVRSQMGLPTNGVAASVFRGLALVRNICAHHGRLWNRVLDASIQVPSPVASRLGAGGSNASPMAFIETCLHVADHCDPGSPGSALVRNVLSESDPLFVSGLSSPRR